MDHTATLAANGRGPARGAGDIAAILHGAYFSGLNCRMLYFRNSTLGSP